MRYKILCGSCTYGGMETPADSTVMSDATLTKALDFLRCRLEFDVYESVEVGKTVRTKADSMGCYTVYLLKEDRSPDTIWAHLSNEEKVLVLRAAIDGLQLPTTFGTMNRELMKAIMVE